MTSNLLTWLILAAVVLVSLVLKGYVKLPSWYRPGVPIQYAGSPPSAAHSQPTLDGWDSYSLGIAFAKAKRAEAEHELAHLIATQAGETIKKTFTDPFSPPVAPAGQEPQAGPSPS